MDNVLKFPTDNVARLKRIVKRKIKARDYQQSMEWFVFEIDGETKVFTEEQLKEIGILK